MWSNNIGTMVWIAYGQIGHDILRGGLNYIYAATGLLRDGWDFATIRDAINLAGNEIGIRALLGFGTGSVNIWSIYWGICGIQSTWGLTKNSWDFATKIIQEMLCIC